MNRTEAQLRKELSDAWTMYKQLKEYVKKKEQEIAEKHQTIDSLRKQLHDSKTSGSGT